MAGDARAAELLGRPQRRRLARTTCARAETVVVWSSLHHHRPAPPSPLHPRWHAEPLPVQFHGKNVRTLAYGKHRS